MSRRRRRSLWWLVVLVALGLLIQRGLRQHTFRPAPTEGWRVVERVIDGDTLKLDGGERVRLIGVDTPELGDSRAAVRAYARLATEFVRQACEGQRVRLEYNQQLRDRYGRTLAYVYLENGTFLNAELIRQGYGFAYTRFPFTYLEEFRQLEQEARAAERGLWAR